MVGIVPASTTFATILSHTITTAAATANTSTTTTTASASSIPFLKAYRRELTRATNEHTEQASEEEEN